MTSRKTRPAISQEFVTVIVAEEEGKTFGTGNPDFAFIVGDGDPVDADWHAGEWVDAGALVRERFIRRARVMAGPIGGFTPVAGTTTVIWCRFPDSPEAPVRQAGSMTWV